MQSVRAVRYVSGSIRAIAWVDRVVALAVVLLLALQLLNAAHHKDDHAGYSGDCPSCFFAHHVPHGLPDVDPVLVPVAAAHSYSVEPVAILPAPVLASFLIPHSHAPPRA